MTTNGSAYDWQPSIAAMDALAVLWYPPRSKKSTCPALPASGHNEGYPCITLVRSAESKKFARLASEPACEPRVVAKSLLVGVDSVAPDSRRCSSLPPERPCGSSLPSSHRSTRLRKVHHRTSRCCSTGPTLHRSRRPHVPSVWLIACGVLCHEGRRPLARS